MFSANALIDLCDAKQHEIGRRGLMSFPVDSSTDQENQLALEREIIQLTDYKIYESPTTGLRLPVDNSFSAKMLYYFLIGDYEQHDMQLIRKYVTPGSRVLELGGGVGLTGSLLGQISGNPVTVCEPNPELHARIVRTFAANQARLNLQKVAVTSDNESANYVLLHVCKEYWWSSLVGAEDALPVQVQARKLGWLISEARADTLVVDIEGYEVDLFLSAKSLAAIKTVLVEIHTPSIGCESTANVITALFKCGFELVDIGGHTFVFSRPSKRRIEPGVNGPWY